MFAWFVSDRMSDVTEQTTFVRVDIDKSTTIGRLHFELDKLKHGVDCLERSSFACVFHMDSQKEGEKRGKIIACTAKESSTDMVHYSIIDAPGHRDFNRFRIDDIPEPCDAAGRRCRRSLSEMGFCHS